MDDNSVLTEARPPVVASDSAEAITVQLAEVRSAFKTADETFRIFRGMLLEHPPEWPDVLPLEWIPISDH